jgi:hypothetical protein
VKPDDVIRERLASLAEMVNGYDFGQVVAAYWKGHDTGNEVLRFRCRPLAARRVRHPHRRARGARGPHDHRRWQCLRSAEAAGALRAPGRLCRTAGVLRRARQSLQDGEHQTADALSSHLRALADTSADPIALARDIPNKIVEKHHPLLSDDLLAMDYASDRLDLAGSRAVAQQVTLHCC